MAAAPKEAALPPGGSEALLNRISSNLSPHLSPRAVRPAPEPTFGHGCVLCTPQLPCPGCTPLSSGTSPVQRLLLACDAEVPLALRPRQRARSSGWPWGSRRGTTQRPS